jgi:uncharacterized integral membrane protein
MSAQPAQKSSRDGRADAAGRNRRETGRAGGLVVLAALFIVFALLNLNEVKVNWILGSGRAPLIIVIVISLLVGIVLTYFADRLGRRRRQ